MNSGGLDEKATRLLGSAPTRLRLGSAPPRLELLSQRLCVVHCDTDFWLERGGELEAAAGLRQHGVSRCTCADTICWLAAHLWLLLP